MRNLFFSNRSKMQFMVLLFTLVSPIYSFAGGDMQTAKLTNQTKKDGSAGLYLVENKTLSENNCVKYNGAKKVLPGESTSFDMPKDCTWGNVEFKVFTVAKDELVGYLSYSIRDGETSMELKTTCKDNQCNFAGITS